MQANVLILIPRLNLSGPVRGAHALYNGLASAGVGTELIPLYKTSKQHENFANLMLVERSSFLEKISIFRKYFYKSKSLGYKTIVVSYCLQADFLAFFSGLRSYTICSVRGNLYRNYADDYGLKGYLIAWLHYRLVSTFPVVTALNVSMQKHLQKFSNRVKLIPNFLDEKSLRGFEAGPEKSFKFVFVGRLSPRKGVFELVQSFIACLKEHPSAELHIIGDGKIKNQIEALIKVHNVHGSIKLYGHLDNPLNIVKKSDVFVLPSYAEGISRAAMEALYLGKRCIMQDVDGNKELIKSDKQGLLIEGIGELTDAMLTILRLGRTKDEMRLPREFRQRICTNRYIEVIEKFY